MASFVRLMVIKQRTGWGYETLVREVSDSLHLRRFCLIAIDQRVPEESTVRKLARRLGAMSVTRMSVTRPAHPDAAVSVPCLYTGEVTRPQHSTPRTASSRASIGPTGYLPAFVLVARRSRSASGL